MPNIPFPGFGDSKEEIKGQGFELIRKVYEEKAGGADLGDVFSIVGDTLVLALDVDNPGLEKSDGYLSIQHKSDGGTKGTDNGLSLKLADNSLTLTDSGLRLTTPTTPYFGTAAFPTGAQSITINNANVQTDSRIFITLEWATGRLSRTETLYVSNLIPGVSFGVYLVYDLLGMPAPGGDVHWMIINP